MRKILYIFALISFLTFGLAVLAQDSDLPDPGLTPDSPFYFLKTWKETIQTFFTFGAENKAKQFLHLAEVRLAEYQKMIEKGKTEIAQRTLDKYEKQLNHALEKAEGKEKLKEKISEKILKHQGVLEDVLEKVPEEAKEGLERAIENSQKALEKTIKAASEKEKEELEETEETEGTEEEAELGEELEEEPGAQQGTAVEKQEEEKITPSAYHIKNVSYYREDNFCYGAGAMMLVKYAGLTEQEVQEYRSEVRAGLGGPPDIFKGFKESGLIDEVRIGYSKNYNQQYAGFYNSQLLVRPKEQTVLFDDKNEALDYLKKLVSSDILVMVIAHYGNHYLIVKGYDENYIYINDPGFDDGYSYEGGLYKEQTKMAINEFLNQWAISGFEGGGIGFPGDYGMVWLVK